MKKLLILLTFIFLVNLAWAQVDAPIFNVETETQGVPGSLSFLMPLSYQAGPGQEIQICGSISVPSNSPTHAVLDIYTRLECSGASCSELFESKKVEYWYKYLGVEGHGGPYSVSDDRYPSSGYTTFTLAPGDYLKICWKLRVKSYITKEAKVRAYFYAKETRFNIVKEKYSNWVDIKAAKPIISGWNINIAIYGGLSILAILAVLKKLGKI